MVWALLGLSAWAGAAREVELALRSGDLRLAATLVLPPGHGPFPAMALLSGSGPTTRAGYLELARGYAARGVAALVWDQRGAGRSEGGGTFSFAELADDAVAAVELLRRQPEVDPGRVGLWGLSQGGWTAPLAAARSTKVGFVVAVSASGVPPAQQELWRTQNNLRRGGVPAAPVAAFAKAWRTLLSARDWPLPQEVRRALVLPAPDFFLDPVAVWQKVRQRTLLVYGALDRSVPPGQSAALIVGALRAGGNERVSLRVYPGADHSLRRSASGYQFEGPPGAYVPGYLNDTARWMRTGRTGKPAVVERTRPPELLPAVALPPWGRLGPQLALLLLAPLAMLALTFAPSAREAQRARPAARRTALFALGGTLALGAFTAQVIAAEGTQLDLWGAWPPLWWGVVWLWSAAGLSALEWGWRALGTGAELRRVWLAFAGLSAAFALDAAYWLSP